MGVFLALALAGSMLGQVQEPLLCSGFRTQADAQAYLLGNPSEPHRLDDNADGLACEALPCPCAGRDSPLRVVRAGYTRYVDVLVATGHR